MRLVSYTLLKLKLKMVFKMLLFAIFVTILTPSSAETDKVVCYLGTWSTYRLSNGKFNIEDVDPNLCTHIIYSFIGINSDGSVRILDQWLDFGLKGFQRFVALKERNPRVKTMIAIGGFNEPSARFSAVTSNPNLRKAFVANILNFITNNGFDGLDLDWEYPAQLGGQYIDKINFGLLIKELREAFDKVDPSLVLSAAVLATQSAIDISYDVPTMAKYLNFINIMAYDLHGSWDKITGIHAALYAHPTADSTYWQKQLNVDASISAWINAGAPPEKIILGLAIYGKTFTLSSVYQNGIGAPTIGGGYPGQYTLQEGMLGYNEICELQMQGGWTVLWESTQQVPYAYKGNQWVGYDNERSIKIKVEYAKARSLGGAMIWSIDTDDFAGRCGRRYPLLNTINECIGRSEEQVNSTSSSTSSSKPTIPVTEAPPPTNTPPKGPTTVPPSNTAGNLCIRDGYVRDPVDCGIFYYCRSSGGDTFKAVTMRCSSGLYFDPSIIACNYPSLVSC